MKEWSNPWNPFNSAKGLLWREHLEGCAKDDYLPPVTVDLDPANRCMFDCPHCFDGEEEITLFDFSSKKIKEIIPGDIILGLNEKNRMVSNKVLRVYDNGIATEMLKFTFEDGDTFLCTREHLIWHSRGRWKYAKNFHVGETVKKVFRHNRIDYDLMEYKKGYIAGISEGDGCLWLSKNRKSKSTYRFRLFMNDIKAVETFAKYCNEFEILWHWGYHQYRGHKDYQKDQIFKKKALWITSDIESRKIKKIIETKNITRSFKIGWLAGIFDAEGSDSGSLRISQSYKNNNIRKKIIKYCSDLGYRIKEEDKAIRMYADRYSRINFYLDHNIQIKRKLKKVVNQKVKCRKKIIGIEVLRGKFNKYDLETETHNYLVKGVLVHNCNAYDMISSKGGIMSEQHMIKLVDFLAHWRDSTRHNTPNSACVSGGGEPYMNKNINALFERMYFQGMQRGILSTGFLLTDEDIDVVARTARWFGFSMDAANMVTYAKIKGIDNLTAFNKTIENMKKLVKRIAHYKSGPGSDCDVAFKYLLTPDNADEIYSAIKLAKEIGVKDFHLRPAGWDNLSKVKDKPVYENLAYINDQIEQGMRLETKDFRVFGIRHKFNPDFSRKLNFSRCWAIPMLPTFGADGNVHMCFDMRGRKDLIMCRHDPDPSEILKFWNTDKHRKMIKGVQIENCPRCFVPETEIMGSTGVKKISEIKKDERVYAGDFSLGKVSRIYKNNYTGEMISISYFGDNRKLVVTPNHKLHTIEIKRCSYSSRETIACLIDDCSYLRMEKKCKYPGCGHFHKDYVISKTKAEDLREDHFLVIPKYKEQEENKYSKIESDLAWLIGMYIAEGHSSEAKVRDYSIRFYLGETETYYADKIEEIVYRNYGVKSQKRYIRNGSLSITFHCKQLRDILLLFGNRAHQKRIPRKVMVGLNKHSIESLLRGYFDGDGCYFSSGNITATTVSLQLAYDIKMLFSKVDIFSTIYELPKRNSTINGRLVKYKHTPYLIRLSSSKRLKRMLKDIIKFSKNPVCNYYETKDIFAVPINKIERIFYDGDVYNLEVMKKHTYTVNGVAVDNCTFGAYNEIVEKVIIDDSMCMQFP